MARQRDDGEHDDGERRDGERWEAADAAAWIAVPEADDDKYSRGVLGMITGSARYPGAAVLGVEAAMRTGVGMVRYLGAERAATLVLQRRPEVVTAPGRVQAWLAGSGMDATQRTEDETRAIRSALAERVPVVLDAGALDLVAHASGPLVITPHFRELSVALGHAGSEVSADTIAAAPGEWALQAAHRLRAIVLLKGHTTHVATPSGRLVSSSTGPGWLATAGTGDVLAGILGALVATHSAAIARDADVLADLAATAAVLGGLAAQRASGGGPIAALDLAQAVPATIAELLAGRHAARHAAAAAAAEQHAHGD